MREQPHIRAAAVDDVPAILALVRELADYERLSHLVTATEEDFRTALFGPQPAAEAVLALEGDTPVGFALYFHNFSTFLGRRGLWLEDLFVRPAYRHRGYGKALLLHVARLAAERGCGRFEWAALDWNTPAWEFYRARGATPLEEWTMFRLTGDALARLSRNADTTG
jgi:GNAT superfamily N-acetyltransferase